MDKETYKVLEGVECLDFLALSLVLGCETLGVGNHAVNLLLGETALLVGDGDRLRLASALVGGANLHDTVGVNLEGDLNLRNTTRRRRNARQLELAEQVVVLRQRTLSLVHLDQHGGLVISRSREASKRASDHAVTGKSGGDIHLALASGDDGVAGDELGHDTTGGLNTERERADIDEDDVLEVVVSGEDTTLDGSAVRDSLVRIDSLRGLLAEILLEELLDLGDTGRTTDEDDLGRRRQL